MHAVILARSTTHRSLSIPLFLDRVPAGFPSPAQDYVEQTLDLNDLCIRHPAATYFVRAEGDSMVEVGIFSGDVLVVDRSLNAEHGDIVIASINGDMTVKQLETRPRIRLKPCNPKYSVIHISEAYELEIFGVVTNVIHRLKRGNER